MRERRQESPTRRIAKEVERSCITKGTLNDVNDITNALHVKNSIDAADAVPVANTECGETTRFRNSASTNSTRLRLTSKFIKSADVVSNILAPKAQCSIPDLDVSLPVSLLVNETECHGFSMSMNDKVKSQSSMQIPNCYITVVSNRVYIENP